MLDCCVCYEAAFLYIYYIIYMYIKNPNFIVCDCFEHQKITYFSIQINFGTVFLRQLKESLKLTKGITWRHSNIVLKLEKMNFKNTLKNIKQLGEEINSTKGTEQLQNKKTNIEDKMACLSQLISRDRRCCSNRKNLYSPHCCLVKVINK